MPADRSHIPGLVWRSRRLSGRCGCRCRGRGCWCCRRGRGCWCCRRGRGCWCCRRGRCCRCWCCRRGRGCCCWCCRRGRGCWCCRRGCRGRGRGCCCWFRSRCCCCCRGCRSAAAASSSSSSASAAGSWVTLRRAWGDERGSGPLQQSRHLCSGHCSVRAVAIGLGGAHLGQPGLSQCLDLQPTGAVCAVGEALRAERRLQPEPVRRPCRGLRPTHHIIGAETLRIRRAGARCPLLGQSPHVARPPRRRQHVCEPHVVRPAGIQPQDPRQPHRGHPTPHRLVRTESVVAFGALEDAETCQSLDGRRFAHGRVHIREHWISRTGFLRARHRRTHGAGNDGNDHRRPQTRPQARESSTQAARHSQVL